MSWTLAALFWVVIGPSPNETPAAEGPNAVVDAEILDDTERLPEVSEEVIDTDTGEPVEEAASGREEVIDTDAPRALPPTGPSIEGQPIAAPTTVPAEPATDAEFGAQPGAPAATVPEASAPRAHPRSRARRRASGVLPNNGALRRTGLWGWGLGLEVPMVGVTTGAATRSTLGVGYNLGGALSWEVMPTLLIRWYVATFATKNARAPVSFMDEGERVRRKQAAEWFGVETGAGAAYLFRGDGRAWTPFAGADIGVAFNGWEYELDEELDGLRDDRDLTTAVEEGGLYGTAVGLTAGVRGGMRLELTDWLASMAELSVAYTRVPEGTVSNTIAAPDVRTVPDTIWLVRGTFSVRLGL